MRRLRRTAYLGRCRNPAARGIPVVILHHLHGAFAHLVRMLVRSLANGGFTVSRVGALGTSGAVQTKGIHYLDEPCIRIID